MQTVLSARSPSGPASISGNPPAPGAEVGSRDATGDDPGREDATRDGFASFMADPSEKDLTDAAPQTIPAPETPLAAVAFWPVAAVNPAPTVDKGASALPIGGQLVAIAPVLTGETVTEFDTPVPPPPATNLASAEVDLPASARIEGAAPRPPTSLPLVEPVLAAGHDLDAPPVASADAAELPPAPSKEEPAPIIPANSPPQPVAPALPGPALAVAGMRFWQAAPQVTSDPLAGAAISAASIDPSATEAPATRTTSAPPAIAPPAVLVAKLAETALLSLFAAQAEAAAQLSAEAEGLGLASSVSTLATLPVTPSAAVLAPSALPHLTAQLVQTVANRPDGSTEIALSPAELGHVRVTLQADAQNPDRIIVMLNFERFETLDLFRRHADQLAEALRDAGFSGADIGFGRSDGGDRHDARPDGPTGELPFADGLPSDLIAGPPTHLAARHQAASGTLDLRL